MKRAIPLAVLFGLAIGMLWSQREARRVRPDSFQGLVVDGKSIYIGGGSAGSVYQAELEGTQLRLAGRALGEAGSLRSRSHRRSRAQ